LFIICVNIIANDPSVGGVSVLISDIILHEYRSLAPQAKHTWYVWRSMVNTRLKRRWWQPNIQSTMISKNALMECPCPKWRHSTLNDPDNDQSRWSDPCRLVSEKHPGFDAVTTSAV